ncbi:hypothetical protein BaRGS_00024623, partial [Batillaria attramentaria]
ELAGSQCQSDTETAAICVITRAIESYGHHSLLSLISTVFAVRSSTLDPADTTELPELRPLTNV